jgi:hypothetical protein
VSFVSGSRHFEAAVRNIRATFAYSLNLRHRKLPYGDSSEIFEDLKRKQGLWARKAASGWIRAGARHERSVAGHLQIGGSCLAERSDSQRFLGNFLAPPDVGSHGRIHAAPHNTD